ncbi:MAG: hypothetical protein Q8J96_16465 [Rhodocyclaceae bacterium]|nr:hypothetical protein [Rhodocyclaceae bacterium]
MSPPIEPRPHDDLQRVIYDTHPWPLMGAGDVAFHEAGHVVIGLTLGMPCHDARITPEGTAGRAGVMNPVNDKSITTTTPQPPVEVSEIYQQTSKVIWPGMPPAAAALNNATMLVAGRQAELIHAGIRLTGTLHMHDADHQQARAILLASGQRLAMCWAQRMARHLLTSAWPEVEAIAAELRSTGTWTNPVAWARQASPSKLLQANNASRQFI